MSSSPAAAIDTRVEGPSPSDDAQHEVVVIGGGITGCATAYHLAKAGIDVALVERSDLNTEASGRNAGSLHGQIQHPPFLERGEDWARNFLPALSFLVESLAIWRDLSTELDTNLEVTTAGGLLVAETVQQLRDIERKVSVERSGGFDPEILGVDDLRSIAPYISPHMVGAEFAPVEGVANPLLAAPAFAREATRRGATIRTQTNVLGIDRETNGMTVHTSVGALACRQVVVAAGSGIRSLVSANGAKLPIEEEAIQLSVTEPVEPLVDHLVYFAGGALTFKQAKAGSLLIGGGWPAARDPATGWARVDPQSLRGNLRVAQKVAPAIGGVRVVRAWAGVARRTPDLMPIVGAVGGEPGIIVGMFPHMGLTAGPLLGKVLADLALGREVDRNLAPFSPDRF